MLSQTVNPLEDLANKIVESCLIQDYRWALTIESLINLHSESGLARLTYLECVYVAQKLRERFGFDRSEDAEWADFIFTYIGEKPNILNKVFNIAVMGIVAFMAYKVIRR